MRPPTPMSRIARQIAVTAVLAVTVSATSRAQTRVVSTPSAVLGSPKGRAIGSVHPGLAVRVLETRGAYARVSIDGFVERVRLSAERRGSSPRVGNRAAVVRSRGGVGTAVRARTNGVD
jgi:hypothetical protein